MNLWESVKIALRALRSNKMRTGLTMLGIIIGVGAVIAMVAIGQGAANQIKAQFESMGTNLLIVRAGTPRMRFGGGGPPTGSVTSLTTDDAKLIGSKFKDTISMVSAVSRGNGDLKMGSKAWSTSVIGATPEYETVAKFPVDEGRFLSQSDEDGRARVILLGKSTIENLTGDRDTNVVGQQCSVNRVEFKIVGILKEKGAGAFGQDQDDIAIIPCSTAMRRVFSRKFLSEIDVTCLTPADMDLATQQITTLMRDRHKLHPPFPDNDDFNVRSQAQILEASAQSSQTMTSLLGGIALVSLMVGGIGIMNIMLVSVTERTREIGIRKAVGATSHHIMLQFLIEAVVISTLGGALGIGLGVGVSKLLGSILGWQVLVEPVAVVGSVVVSAVIGIFFGLYPASKAAQLNPIEALRFE